MEQSLTNQDRDLLKFNYENLHKSTWENHKLSWVVTSIFIPIIFAMQGYFIREYFTALNTSATGVSIVQVCMGAFVIQSLAFVWWLIIKIFTRYNDARRTRLKVIENIFLTKRINIDEYPVKQYALHGYTLMFNWKNNFKQLIDSFKKLFDCMKHPNKENSNCGIKITYNRVCDLVLVETSVINILLILYTMYYI